MSAEASIQIKFNVIVDVKTILENLIKNGWSYNDHGSITFLISDDFDWDGFELEQIEKVNSMIEERIQNKQLVGITLIHETLNSGGNFHFDTIQNEIMISLLVNRLKILHTEITDYNVYITKILPYLPPVISSIIFCDVY